MFQKYLRKALAHLSPAQPRKPNQIRDFPAFFTHIKTLGFNPQTIIDVGVANGTPSLYDAFSEAYLILIEPLPIFEPSLKDILARRHGEYHLCAASDRTGSRRICRASALDSTSIERIATPDSSDFWDVTLAPLDSLISPERLAAPILLKTDAQSADIQVLRGATNTLRYVDVAIVETNLFPFANSDNQLIHVVNEMASNGFYVYDILKYLARPYDNALGQIDLAFVRTESSLRTYPDWI